MLPARVAGPRPSTGFYRKVLLLVAAVIVLIGWRARSYFTRSSSETQVALTNAPETMAVLPFRDISDATSDNWGIGITDAIISRLTSLQNLAVRPTTSVLKYAKETPEPAEAAKALGVESVLEGTYQRSSNVIRVTVQLIDGHSGTTRWSQRYDLKSADILSFEDEVATKVVEGLQIQISPTEQKSIQQPVTSSVEAYNDYLQARSYWNEYLMYSQVESIDKGRHLLQHAISLDQGFGDAYALLAQFDSFQAANFVEDADAHMKSAEAAAKIALRLNPRSTEGLIALGGLYGEAGREGEAIPTLREAVTLAPNSETAWQMLGYAYYYAGLNDLAERGYQRVVDLNPIPPQPHWMHARMLLYNGRLAEADQEMRDVVAKHPDQFKALAYFGALLYYEGKLNEAEGNLVRGVQLTGNSKDLTAPLLAAFLYASRNQREKIDPQLLRYRPNEVIDGDQAYWTGGIYALLGDKENALVWLKRTVELGNVNYPWFQRDKNYNRLRGDPDYEAIMKGIKQRWETYKSEFDSGR